MYWIACLSLSLVPALPSPAPPGAHQVTLLSLVEELADFQHLTRFPSPPFTTRQASSYDRASRSPADHGTWFANADRGHYMGVEEIDGRKEHVLLDVPGPGAVVRIWSANPQGTLRIYTDGMPSPVLEAPMGELLRGRVPPFEPPLAHEASRGCNIYFPFTYAKRCKITSDQGDFYYHVNHRTYPEGTSVEPYSPAKLEAVAEALRRAVGVLKEPSRALEVWGGEEALRRTAVDLRLQGGAGRAGVLVAAPPGGGVIVQLELKPSRTGAEALRGCLLTMSFDGRETVWAPLGDFFGTGPGLNPYDSLPLSVAADGTLTCRWPMPFREKAVLELRGPGGDLEIRGAILHAPRVWDDRSLLFHARWRAERGMKTDPPRDWNYVALEGRGIYAGNVLNVANPVRAWWGEGDEKIYVDGEAFPSHFGTGTEDYYGYAWCCPELFTHAYHSQTRCDGPGNFGHTSVNRWHLIDAIPFEESFRFDMEVWHWDRRITVSYDCVNYWYAAPGARDNVPRVPLDLPEVPELKVLKVEGALEGERLEIVERSGGVAEPQDMAGFGDHWSWGEHLWWRGARPGDRLVLRFDAPRAGRFRVKVRLTKAVDYGIHQLSVNGVEAGGPVDLWNDGVVPAELLDLGVFELARGGNRLRVEIRGTNPEARPAAYMFGLDYILLEPAGDQAF